MEGGGRVRGRREVESKKSGRAGEEGGRAKLYSVKGIRHLEVSVDDSPLVQVLETSEHLGGVKRRPRVRDPRGCWQQVVGKGRRIDELGRL